MAKKKVAAPAQQETATPPAQEAAAPVQQAETQALPKQPSQNGVTRPRSGTATGRVWEIADELSAQKGAPAPRGDVMAAGKAENLNEATIATQYGRWRKFHGLGRYQAEAAQAETETAEVETEGEE